MEISSNIKILFSHPLFHMPLEILSVKRLMKEAAELKDPTDHYHAQPLEDNLFEWHFTVRGPPDSDFDGGVYHGRIVLPPEYPMKPPSIILLTVRVFEVGKKICLSISGHHPETWQPSWSIRTALLAIIGFMPTKGEGAIGSLDYTPEERRALAKKSQDFYCEGCGSLMKEALLPLTSGSASSQAADKEAKELARQISFKAEVNSSRKSVAEPANLSDRSHSDSSPEHQQESTIPSENRSNSPPSSPESNPQPVANATSLSPRQRRAQQRRVPASTNFNQGQQPRVNADPIESNVLILVLVLALAALIFRRICLSNEYIFEL
uniref:Ubiquitin-conjugating enzyme E2 J1 n=1 Tax=Anolis carolinensis TaxID=28377 RepID=G1KQ28_ANOCA